MSVAFADYDADGVIDVFVTNDARAELPVPERGDGTFEETGAARGRGGAVARPRGLEHGDGFQDYDNDGRPDIHLTALAGETFPLYRNQGGGAFVEATQSSGLAVLGAKLSGWARCSSISNNDGWKDLFTANSHVNDRVESFEATVYKQPNSVFLNTGGGKFRDGQPMRGRSSARPSRRIMARPRPISMMTAASTSRCRRWARPLNCGGTPARRPATGSS